MKSVLTILLDQWAARMSAKSAKVILKTYWGRNNNEASEPNEIPNFWFSQLIG